MQLPEKQELVRLLGLYQSELLMENEENLRKKMRSNESPKKIVTDYSYGVKAQYEHARIIIKKLSVEIGKELKASWELW
jgi:ABC-type Na+ transport system ATPase subunit NatA